MPTREEEIKTLIEEANAGIGVYFMLQDRCKLMDAVQKRVNLEVELAELKRTQRS